MVVAVDVRNEALQRVGLDREVSGAVVEQDLSLHVVAPAAAEVVEEDVGGAVPVDIRDRGGVRKRHLLGQVLRRVDEMAVRGREDQFVLSACAHLIRVGVVHVSVVRDEDVRPAVAVEVRREQLPGETDHRRRPVEQRLCRVLELPAASVEEEHRRNRDHGVALRLVRRCDNRIKQPVAVQIDGENLDRSRGRRRQRPGLHRGTPGRRVWPGACGRAREQHEHGARQDDSSCNHRADFRSRRQSLELISASSRSTTAGRFVKMP